MNELTDERNNFFSFELLLTHFHSSVIGELSTDERARWSSERKTLENRFVTRKYCARVNTTRYTRIKRQESIINAAEIFICGGKCMPQSHSNHALDPAKGIQFK